MQYVGVRPDMGEALEHGQRKLRRRHLEGEALADEPGKLRLVVERIEARNHAAGAMAEQEDRQAGSARPCRVDGRRHVGDIVGDRLHIEALAVRLTASAQVDRIDGQAQRRQAVCHPQIIATMCVETGHNDHDTTDLSRGLP